MMPGEPGEDGPKGKQQPTREHSQASSVYQLGSSSSTAFDPPLLNGPSNGPFPRV